jgi:hypothetical protein
MTSLLFSRFFNKIEGYGGFSAIFKFFKRIFGNVLGMVAIYFGDSFFSELDVLYPAALLAEAQLDSA